MAKSRRQFLAETSLAVLGAAAAVRAQGQTPAEQIPAEQNPAELPPGAPPAFGAGPAVGPEVSTATFAEAEKLVQFEMTPAERAVAAESWRQTMAALYERRTGPRKVALEQTVAPASRWDPALPGMKAGPQHDRFVRSAIDASPLPARDEDIAFASVTQLSRWIETRKLTSWRLTDIYLKRLEEFDPKLHCVITLTRELALRQAKQADDEYAAVFDAKKEIPNDGPAKYRDRAGGSEQHPVAFRRVRGGGADSAGRSFLFGRPEARSSRVGYRSIRRALPE